LDQSFPVQQRTAQRLAVEQRERELMRGESALKEALRRSLDGSANTSRPKEGMDDFVGHIAPCPNQLLGNAKLLAGRLKDNNGLVEDSMKEHLELDHINVWTSEEKTVFFEKMMNYYKKFGKIAAALPNKSCADCVKFYYRTKKHIKYKEKRDEMRRIKAQKRKLQQQSKQQEYRAFMTGQAATPIADTTEALPTFDSPLHTNPKQRKPTIAEQLHDRMRASRESSDTAAASPRPKLMAKAAQGKDKEATNGSQEA